MNICGTPTSGELRLNYAGVEVVFKVAHIASIDVDHPMHDVTRFGSLYREYVSAGYSNITLRGMVVHEDQTKPLSDKDWADVSGIVQAAGTTSPARRRGNMLYEFLADMPNPFREQPEADDNAIARAFYAGEAKREEARVEEFYADHNWD